MLPRLWALIIKELLNILRDPKSRTVLIVPPVIQIFVFSFAMTMEAKNVPLGILNLDAGREGYELVERFRSASMLREDELGSEMDVFLRDALALMNKLAARLP